MGGDPIWKTLIWMDVQNSVYFTREELILESTDMALLIEVEDELHNMDKALEQLAGHGHASGDFDKLDNVFEVICRNSHEYYNESDESTELLYQILRSRELTPEERADILMNAKMRVM